MSRTGGARRDQPFVVVPTAPTGRLPRSSSKPEARPGRRRRAEALRSDGARPPNPQRLVDARTDLRRPWAAPDTSSVSCWYGRCCSRALAARALREARGPRWRCDRRGLRPSAHACHFPYRGPQALEAFTSRGGAIPSRPAGDLQLSLYQVTPAFVPMPHYALISIVVYAFTGAGRFRLDSRGSRVARRSPHLRRGLVLKRLNQRRRRPSLRL